MNQRSAEERADNPNVEERRHSERRGDDRRRAVRLNAEERRQKERRRAQHCFVCGVAFLPDVKPAIVCESCRRGPLAAVGV